MNVLYTLINFLENWRANNNIPNGDTLDDEQLIKKYFKGEM